MMTIQNWVEIEPLTWAKWHNGKILGFIIHLNIELIVYEDV